MLLLLALIWSDVCFATEFPVFLPAPAERQPRQGLKEVNFEDAKESKDHPGMMCVDMVGTDQLKETK